VLQRVFEPILKAEAKSTRGSTRKQALLSPANYRAQTIGQEWQLGRECWVLAIEPEHRSKYVIRGKVWVDAREFEPVQLQGRPAASVSFWVGEPSIVEQFAKQNGFWMPARMTSKSSGLLLDSSELTIAYYEYEFSLATSSAKPVRHSRRKSTLISSRPTTIAGKAIGLFWSADPLTKSVAQSADQLGSRALISTNFRREAIATAHNAQFDADYCAR